jgi:hypothetical protein
MTDFEIEKDVISLGVEIYKKGDEKKERKCLQFEQVFLSILTILI